MMNTQLIATILQGIGGAASGVASALLAPGGVMTEAEAREAQEAERLEREAQTKRTVIFVGGAAVVLIAFLITKK